MKRSVLVSLSMVALAAPALAAEKFFLVIDTVGNCAVIQGMPSGGMIAFGEKGGYDTKDTAAAALKAARDDPKAGCEGVVE